jgi:hypothetical protein
MGCQHTQRPAKAMAQPGRCSVVRVGEIDKKIHKNSLKRFKSKRHKLFYREQPLTQNNARQGGHVSLCTAPQGNNPAAT